MKRWSSIILILAIATLAPAANAYQLNATGSNPLTFGVGATSSTVAEKMRITSAGLIGIGTATPTTAFTVSGTISATSFVGNGSGLTNITAGAGTFSSLTDVSYSLAAGNIFGPGSLTGATSSVTRTLALGVSALANASNSGYENVGLGYQGLYNNTSGNHNTASGAYAMFTNTTGSYNTGIGGQSLYNNTSGGYNTALGYQSLYGNTTGTNNFGLGYATLNTNATGSNNVAIGPQALYYANPVTGTVAIGYNAGQGNSGGYSYGTYIGTASGFSVTTGSYNTLLGAYAGDSITTGASNIAIGYNIDTPAPAVSSYLNIGNAISGSMLTGGSMTFIGGILAQGVVTATYFEGNGSRLTNLSGGDNITSGTTNITVNSNGYTSLTTGGVTTGYLDTAGRLAVPGIGIGVAPTSTYPIYVSNSGATFGLLLDGPNNYNGVGFYIAGVKQGGIIQESTGNMYYNSRIDMVLRTNGNTERMRVTSGGLVGIGTSNPTSTLHISSTSAYGVIIEGSNSASTRPRINLVDTSLGTVSTQPAWIIDNSSDAFRIFRQPTISTAGVVSMFISSTGVGIGTTTPSGTLHVSASTANGVVIEGNSTTGRAGIMMVDTASGLYSTQPTWGVDNKNDAFRIFRKPTIGASGWEAIHITNTPYVGINNTVPNATLDVVGTVSATTFNGDGSNLTGINEITSGTAYAQAQSGGNVIVSGSMYINNAVSASDAALRIGVNPSGNHYAYIDMAGDSTYTGYGLRIIRYNTGPNAASQIFHRGTGDLTLYAQDAGAIAFLTNSIERMRILSTGFVGIGTATPAVTLHVSGTLRVQNGVVVTCNIGTGTGTTSCTSDKRLKTDIAPIPDSLEKIATLSGVTFHWKDPTAPKGEHLGVIAQDVEKVFPQAVATMENGYKTVDYGVLIAPLIEAVKQLRTENLALKAEQQRTNARLNALEKRLNR